MEINLLYMLLYMCSFYRLILCYRTRWLNMFLHVPSILVVNYKIMWISLADKLYSFFHFGFFFCFFFFHYLFSGLIMENRDSTCFEKIRSREVTRTGCWEDWKDRRWLGWMVVIWFPRNGTGCEELRTRNKDDVHDCWTVKLSFYVLYQIFEFCSKPSIILSVLG